MYYHILIETLETKSKKNVIRITDVEDREYLLNEIVIPYLKEEEFLFNGYILQKKNISRLKIVETEQSAEEIAEFEREKNRLNGFIYIFSASDIIDFRDVKEITTQLISEAKGKIRKVSDQNTKNFEKFDKTKVFIVHGRDDKSKLEVARFVEKLGFSPVILNEQVSSGMTIIEKIEQYSDVGFGIVLYTPCDIGYLQGKESTAQPRARQNVVFEHGYLVGKLGRENVCALVKSGVETPNDISGVVYVDFDDNNGWNIRLAKELKSAGYNVDFNLFL